jgi:hypothetical protein
MSEKNNTMFPTQCGAPKFKSENRIELSITVWPLGPVPVFPRCEFAV